ncbi:unnamed protein product [Somion occarium]|uniref:Uncharacterized protein n=1 Tax=Somion occarium TaxID=3059160 RepID=A0ABP1D3L1_9APHY
MRRPGAPRLNRFPQRLDYTLIPAPLDLALPLVDEKAPLPAIIVTPSSPSGEKDFAIAFLAPPPKPSLRERIASHLPRMPVFPSLQARLPSKIHLPQTPCQEGFVSQPSSWSVKAKARTAVVFAILLFIMVCHLVMHSMITGHAHLEFGLGPDNDMVALNIPVVPIPHSSNAPETESVDRAATPSLGGWFNLHAMWAPVPITEGKRSAHFIVVEDDEDREVKQAS